MGLQLLTIKNKRHGKEYTVTSEEWESMQKKGHGSKVFTVMSTQPVNDAPVVTRKNIQAPPEAVEIVKRKAEASPEVPQPPKVKTGKAAAAKGAKQNA